jgi:cell division control protein 12
MLFTYVISASQNRCQAWHSLHPHGSWYVPPYGNDHTLLNIHQGESGLGKTTLINTLFSTELSPPKNYSRRHVKQLDKLTEVDIIKAELEEKQFRVKLTVIDTPGFGDYVNNRESWAPIVDFIDDQHEAYMLQEQQPERSAKIDLRVHSCLYFIRPTGHT